MDDYEVACHERARKLQLYDYYRIARLIMWSILAPHSKQLKNKSPEELFKLDDETLTASHDDEEDDMTVEEMEEFWNRLDADRVRNPRKKQKLF